MTTAQDSLDKALSFFRFVRENFFRPSQSSLWTRISEALESTIATLDNPRLVRRWLAELRATERGQQLAVDIAIDLETAAVTRPKFCEILKSIRPGWAGPVSAFEEAISRQKSSAGVFCASQHGGSPLDPGDRYVQLLELADFIDSYAGPAYGCFVSTSRADCKEVEMLFATATRGSPIDHLKEHLPPRTKAVTVTSFAALSTMLSHQTHDDAASRISEAYCLDDVAPLAPGGRPHLLGILHPVAVDYREFRKPSSLDIDWLASRNARTSSVGDDDWGHLCPTSAKSSSRKVRVRPPVTSPLIGFEVATFGTCNAVPSLAESALLQHANAHFDNIPGASPPPAPQSS